MEEKKKKKQEEKTKKDIAQKKVKVKTLHMFSNMHINKAPDNVSSQLAGIWAETASLRSWWLLSLQSVLVVVFF